MIRVAVIGLITIVLAMVAGVVKKEYGILVGICGALLVFSIGMQQMGNMLERLQTYFATINQWSPYLQILLKMAGISYLSQLAMSLCKDAGYPSVGNQIGIFGKISILVCCFPVLEALWNTMGQLLETG